MLFVINIFSPTKSVDKNIVYDFVKYWNMQDITIEAELNVPRN